MGWYLSGKAEKVLEKERRRYKLKLTITDAAALKHSPF